MISAHPLVRLIDDIVQMESENRPRNHFLAKIWLKSEYLRQISAQRQCLINLFINTTGDFIRNQRYKTQRDRTVFKTGDKEAFKSLRYRQVRNILIRRTVKNLELQIETQFNFEGEGAMFFCIQNSQRRTQKRIGKSCFTLHWPLKMTNSCTVYIFVIYNFNRLQYQCVPPNFPSIKDWVTFSFTQTQP